MHDIRFGLHWDLRKIRHDFSRATPRSTGTRAVDSARLPGCGPCRTQPPPEVAGRLIDLVNRPERKEQ